jgi:hypothetical protein
MVNPPKDPFAELDRLRRAFGSSDPGARDYLSVVKPGDEFAYGSVAQPLSSRYFPTASGFLVPAALARPTNPLDRTKLFVTPEDVFGPGQWLSPPAIEQQLSTVSLEHTVMWAARLLGGINSPQVESRDVELDFVNRSFNEPHRTRVVNILRDPSRVILIPQALLLLIKWAFDACTEQGVPTHDVSAAPLVASLLSIPAHLDAGFEEDDDAQFIVSKDPNALACYFIANQMLNSSKDQKTAWASFQRCLRELPIELDGHPRVINIEEAYRDATGVQLDDFATVCGLLWLFAISGHTTVELAAFDRLGWDTARLDAALGLICAEPGQMRQMLADDMERFGVVWTTKSFEWFPVIRWSDRITVLSPDLLLRRVSGLWPYFDIARHLEDRGDGKKARKVRQCVDHCYETYALESLAAIAGPRLYREDDLRRAFGKRSSVADGAIDYGHAWVVVDVTTSGFQLLTAAGRSAAAVAQDLEDVVEKAKQVQATIDNIRADEAKLTGRPQAFPRRMFYPVVIVATRFAASPVTMTILRDRLIEAEVLQGEDVAPLEVMELEDLHAIETTVLTGGHSMLALLNEKSSAPMAMMAMREFLLEKFGGNVPHPAHVMDGSRTWVEHIFAQLHLEAA